MIRKIFEDYERITRRNFEQAKRKQDVKLDMIEQKISENLDQLCNEEIRLDSLCEHEPGFLVYMTQTVDEIYSKIANFKPSIDNLDDTMIGLRFKDQSVQMLEETIASTLDIEMDCPRCDPPVNESIDIISLDKEDQQEELKQSAMDAIDFKADKRQEDKGRITV